MREIKKEHLRVVKYLQSKNELTQKKIQEMLGVSDSFSRTYFDLAENGMLDGITFGAEREGTLAIGDLHEPFTLHGYMEFCKHIYDKYKLKHVVFIGDIIDNHYSSYHETDPDGHGAATELLKAKANIKKWYELFPEAKVCIGNHDALPARKGMTAGLSNSWIKTIDEVLETPNWDYNDYHIIDNVKYVHGIGRQAVNRAIQDGISIVQGHYHTKSYANQFMVLDRLLFAMQIGAGIDKDSYAAAYGKHFQDPYVNVGIVKNGVPSLKFM